MNTEETQKTGETTLAPAEEPKLGNKLRFVNVFLLAVLALFIPITVLVSQNTQVVRQNAQTNSNGVTVEILNTGFSPSTVTITTGETVTWINHDTVAHTTVSDTQGTADSWNSHGIGSAQQFSQTFLTAGTYPYHDDLNIALRGTVVVNAGGIQATDTPTPTTETVPSPNCMGSCPTATSIPIDTITPTMPPTDTPTPSETLSQTPTVPDGQSPTPTVFDNPSNAPSIAPSDIPSVPVSEAPGNNGRGGNGQGNKNGGFMGSLVAFLLQLIQFILKLLGAHK